MIDVVALWFLRLWMSVVSALLWLPVALLGLAGFCLLVCGAFLVTVLARLAVRHGPAVARRLARVITNERSGPVPILTVTAESREPDRDRPTSQPSRRSA